ncbi:MAG: DUF2279 domain-containing protein [Bacteroidia bacterium]|nr:DUF2279 domain-containing protein [Bacteroidia bacterium]
MKSALVQSQVPITIGIVSLTSVFCTKLSIILLFIFYSNISFSQDSTLTQHDPYSIKDISINHPKRTLLITSLNLVGYGSSLIILNNTWYKNYPHTSFHTFNDSKEWLQMDKVGHTWAAYNTGKVSSAMWRWAGLSQKKAALIGGLSGAGYLTVIELLDAHSSKWGWSWSDMAANITGSGLFIGQEMLWKEQRIQLKFSFHKNNYGDPQLKQRSDDLYGKSWYERMLKDYNAQTYWFSANIKSFFPKSNLPAWLNVSVGYGADGMFGGFQNKWTDNLGNDVTRYDIARKRQFYLAPDIDFTKIKTNSKFLKTAFSFLNSFKCPAPALMIDSKGKLNAYVLYF